MEVVQKGVGQEPPYFVHQMGNYLVVETDIGLVLLWDKKTSIFLRLSPEFKVRLSEPRRHLLLSLSRVGGVGVGGDEQRETETHKDIEREVRQRDRKIE